MRPEPLVGLEGRLTLPFGLGDPAGPGLAKADLVLQTPDGDNVRLRLYDTSLRGRQLRTRLRHAVLAVAAVSSVLPGKRPVPSDRLVADKQFVPLGRPPYAQTSV